jgi:hypothetical protein
MIPEAAGLFQVAGFKHVKTWRQKASTMAVVEGGET